MASPERNAAESKPAKCPICAKAVEAKGQCFPFCSDRCRKIDLGKWIKGDYKISRPIEQTDLEEER